MAVALVTGATDGIGKSIVYQLLERLDEKDIIIANYGHSDEKAFSLINELPDSVRTRVVLMKADLSDYNSMMELVATIKKDYGKLDYLICNVGVGQYAKFDDYTPEMWNTVMTTNLTNPVFLIKELKGCMGPGGSIMLVGSYAGKKEYSSSVVYSISKAGVLFLAKVLVKELESLGVRINAVAPGFIETGWQSSRSDESRKRINNKIALHRFGTPDEVADMVCGVLLNTYMNGAVIDITGGYEYF